MNNFSCYLPLFLFLVAIGYGKIGNNNTGKLTVEVTTNTGVSATLHSINDKTKYRGEIDFDVYDPTSDFLKLKFHNVVEGEYLLKFQKTVESWGSLCNAWKVVKVDDQHTQFTFKFDLLKTTIKLDRSLGRLKTSDETFGLKIEKILTGDKVDPYFQEWAIFTETEDALQALPVWLEAGEYRLKSSGKYTLDEFNSESFHVKAGSNNEIIISIELGVRKIY